MPNQQPASAWIFGNSLVRVGTQGLFRPYLKTFVPPFLPTRLTAPRSPRMSIFQNDGNTTFLYASISLAEIAREILTWSEAWRGNYHKDKKLKKWCHFGIRCMYLFVFLLTMRVCWVFQNEWLSMLLSAVVTVESRLYSHLGIMVTSLLRPINILKNNRPSIK